MSVTPRSEERERTDLALATQFAKQGDYEQAILQLKQLLETNPRHEIANGMLAGIYAELGMHERAVEYFKQVLAVDPKNPLARFQLGMVQLGVKQPQEALLTWAPFLNERGEFLACFYSGMALLQLGKTEEAHKMLTHAEKNMPRDHALYPQLRETLDGFSGTRKQ